ncbi:linear amide C-N hydrolase [Paracoccus aminophilus]|uniref:Choloylglycine hydrolase n=1 Tax=Paracoccus aminophilus JCM 7686 TaxID=1367847 RepID=S5XS37_PARAH|nr:linear amide C-N hydrolase [Paracoccus aminophilus]AGT07937.1 choloylglycine hydrolase [Paracoccus aminophilus JCM 7686]
MFRKLALTFSVALMAAAPIAEACTRVIYHGPDGRVLTVRSMDWSLPMVSNLWVFPRGMTRSGEAGPRSLEWTSKYGSLIVTGYDISTVDGMNEAGLTANMLWLVSSDYPKDDGKTPQISLSLWAQYVMDNYATVAEAVADMQANPIHVVTSDVPMQPGRLATVHLSLSDPSGDSAILEWIDGALQIHHGPEFRVMTNDPPYDEQLAITSYWQGVNPREMLPGTTRAPDRFTRAGTYIDMVVQSDDPRTAAAAAFSVIRNVSVPYGISTPDAPNLSTTRWRVVADQKDRLFYVESAISPNIFWVDLKKLDFSEAGGVRWLDLGEDMAVLHSGEVSGDFTPAKPFRFEPAG